MLRWAGLALRRSSGGGGAQGVAPIPSLPLRLSLGSSSLARAVSICWRAAPKLLERAGFGLGFCSLFREGASEGEVTTYVIFHLIRMKSFIVCSGNLLNI